MKISVKFLLLVFIIISFAGCSNQSAEKLNRYRNIANQSFFASDRKYIYYYNLFNESGSLLLKKLNPFLRPVAVLLVLYTAYYNSNCILYT